jgi:FkbM family methyltransferase
MASLLAQPWMIKARNHLRGNPLARGLYLRWRSMFDYEERFGEALLDAVDTHSVVWDVGANIGLYTSKLLERGARQVVCFEPAPAAVEALQAKFGAESTERTVLIMPMALSDASGVSQMKADGAAPTNQLQQARGTDAGLVDVTVARADEVVRDRGVPIPNIVKIDVEGYELEVLKGFGSLLRAPELRAIFVEVHFALLHARGLDDAPERIFTMLADAGFSVRWLDISHACGIRLQG